MASDRETLSRQWQMLRHIPRHPRKTTASDIRSYLVRRGYEVSERTVQRDLVNLATLFPLTVDDREKPFGWSWMKDAESFELPGMTTDEALTWVLAEQHVGQMLPSSTLEHLRPYFKTARQRLNADPETGQRNSWLDKVRSVPPSQPLIPPDIDSEVQRVVSEALLHEHQIELGYRRKGERERKVLQVHPLALVQRGGVMYLFGRLFDYPNARLLAMHRIEQATSLPKRPAEAPPGFNLDEELMKGRLGFGSGEMIDVTLKFFDGKGEHLHETPLSQNQRIDDGWPGNGEIIVTATVPDTPQLRWWLLGFGDGVEIVQPLTLRNEISETISRGAARYSLM